MTRLLLAAILAMDPDQLAAVCTKCPEEWAELQSSVGSAYGRKMAERLALSVPFTISVGGCKRFLGDPDLDAGQASF